MRKSFITSEELDNSPKWQRVTISNEGDEKLHGSKYCIEVEFAKNISIDVKQKDLDNLIRVHGIDHDLNFKAHYDCLPMILVSGNLAEAIPVLGLNFFIRPSVFQQLQNDKDVEQMLNESSAFELYLESTDDLIATNIEPKADTTSQSGTPRSKVGFFESGDNASSSRSNSNPLSVNTTPEKNSSTPEEPSNTIPSPVSPIIKVK